MRRIGAGLLVMAVFFAGTFLAVSATAQDGAPLERSAFTRLFCEAL